MALKKRGKELREQQDHQVFVGEVVQLRAPFVHSKREPYRLISGAELRALEAAGAPYRRRLLQAALHKEDLQRAG